MHAKVNHPPTAIDKLLTLLDDDIQSIFMQADHEITLEDMKTALCGKHPDYSTCTGFDWVFDPTEDFSKLVQDLGYDVVDYGGTLFVEQ